MFSRVPGLLRGVEFGFQRRQRRTRLRRLRARYADQGCQFLDLPLAGNHAMQFAVGGEK